MADEIAKIIGDAVIYAGGGAGVAFLLFRFLGASWIENKFSKHLEKFKHNQEIEIQRLRIEIDSTLSGTIMLQEKEFETIPEAWRLLDSAYSELASLVQPYQQYPGLDRMDEEELEEFLENCVLGRTQKNQVRVAREKWKKYAELIFFHRLHNVNVARSKLSEYVEKNGIFFPKNMKENFESIIKMLHSASIAKAVGQEVNDFKVAGEAWKEVTDKIVPLRKSIEDEIYERLHSHGMGKE